MVSQNINGKHEYAQSFQRRSSGGISDYSKPAVIKMMSSPDSAAIDVLKPKGLSSYLNLILQRAKIEDFLVLSPLCNLPYLNTS